MYGIRKKVVFYNKHERIILPILYLQYNILYNRGISSAAAALAWIIVFTPHNLGWGVWGIIFTDSGLVSPLPPSPGITLLRTVHTAPGRYRVEVIYRGNQRGSSTLYCVQWSAVVY